LVIICVPLIKTKQLFFFVEKGALTFNLLII
jgi:hypothetical protein